MSVKQILFNNIAKIAKKNTDKILDNTITQAKSNNLQVSYTGIYNQATEVEGSLEMPVPFVIAQNAEQATMLKKGTLVGRIYDLGRFASIIGTITPREIEFIKKYITKSIPNKQRSKLRKLRNILEPKYKGRPLLNPAIIKYQGQSTDGGQTYTGNWNFTSKTADMATKGSFEMSKNIL